MNKRNFNITKIFLTIYLISICCPVVLATNSDDKENDLSYSEPFGEMTNIIPRESTILSWSVSENSERAIVHAEVPWEMTSIITIDNSILSWSVNQKDFWSFNKDIFPNGHNASGIEGIPALYGYVFPGENLGKLIGRIGDSGRMFPMGTSGDVFIKNGEGGNYVYLTINDELSQIYGKGFKDNDGSILVTFKQKPMPILNIKLIYYEKCPGYKYALANLEDALTEEKINAQIYIVKVFNIQEAKNLKIVGSPTIRINNKDIDPSIKRSTSYSIKCRSYSYNGKVTGWPPKDLIIEALRKAKKEVELQKQVK